MKTRSNSAYIELEKNAYINQLRGKIAPSINEPKSKDNIKLLLYVMNKVEKYFYKKGMGKVKKEVVMKVLDFFNESFIDDTIDSLVDLGLLKTSNFIIKYIYHFKKKRSPRILRHAL